MAKVETAVVLRFNTIGEVEVVEKALTLINPNRINAEQVIIKDNILEMLQKVKQNLTRLEEMKNVTNIQT